MSCSVVSSLMWLASLSGLLQPFREKLERKMHFFVAKSKQQNTHTHHCSLSAVAQAGAHHRGTSQFECL